MKLKEVAYSYASALWELGAEEGRMRLDRLEEDLQYSWRVLSLSEFELLRALRHPLIPKRDKLMLVREVFSELDELVRNLLLLLVERGRVAYLGGILEEFRRLREEREGLIRAVVFSPFPLGELRGAIRGRLEELTGKEVRLEERLDRSLIGGVKIKMGDLVLDGSVRAKLEQLCEELLLEESGR
ncbi:TPA: ATP synthase F1 subunit delta [Candidatus Bipolaricaulota bacterium]|nr:ATP synthase F1 subunit delta [Candidatus Bipolaricaulota bacterium]